MSPLSTLLLLICYTLAVHSLTDNGAISFTNIGSLHVQGGNCGVNVASGAITLHQDCAPRVYLTSGSGYYLFPNLIGKSIKFTVDVHLANCGCNAAVYFIQVPSGGTNPGYYCDAQCPGTCCNEIDLFEANAHAYQGTLHCGDGSNPCKWGCGVNWKSGNGYGPGGSVIDTNKPYDVTVAFAGSSKTLTSVNIKLVQGSKSLSKTLTDGSCTLKSGYVSGLGSAMSSGRLVMAVSYWAGDMSWLDGCGDHCSRSSSNVVTFKNFQLLNYVAAMSADELASSSDFVGSPGFYAVIGIAVLVVVIAVIAIVVVIKKRRTLETV